MRIFLLFSHAFVAYFTHCAARLNFMRHTKEINALGVRVFVLVRLI